MMIRLLLFLFLAFPCTIPAEEAIVVRLPTESKLIPLYVASIDSDTTISNQHTKALQKVLDFNLSHNGMTDTVASTASLEMLAKSALNTTDLASWKSHGVFYTVITKVRDRKLTTTVVSINAGYTQTINPVTLTGDISNDRTLMHQVADAIHHALFGTPGIASTRILYTVKTRPNNDSTSWISEVWESDCDGSNARQVTHDKTLCVNPVYIPPKKNYASSGSFLYVSYKTGQPKIYIASLNDGKGRRFSYLPGNQLMPAVSLQRNKVSFISDVTNNPDLFLQPFNPDVGAMGKPQQIFSARHSTQGSPTFSPDGTKVAFVSNKDGSPRIFVMKIPKPGTKRGTLRPQLITRRNRENTAPTWSPDGTKLAYCSKTDGIRQIWIYDFSTEKEHQLTQGSGNKENPTWAPNSLHLAFNSASETTSELYIVNLNQPLAVKISNGPGEKRFPCWEQRVQ